MNTISAITRMNPAFRKTSFTFSDRSRRITISASNTAMWPPSRGAIGNRFKTPTEIDNSAIRKRIDTMPVRAALPASWAMPMGPAAGMPMGNAADPLKAIAADPAYSNVTVLTQPVSKLMISEPLDVVWTAQNYHDLHNLGMFHADNIAAFNKSVFDALKPGGVIARAT